MRKKQKVTLDAESNHEKKICHDVGTKYWCRPVISPAHSFLQKNAREKAFELVIGYMKCITKYI